MSLYEVRRKLKNNEELARYFDIMLEYRKEVLNKYDKIIFVAEDNSFLKMKINIKKMLTKAVKDDKI